MAVVAGFTAIALGKALFGGIGCNVLNPGPGGPGLRPGRLPGGHHHLGAGLRAQPLHRIRAHHLHPALHDPAGHRRVGETAVDGFTGATPLARWKFENVLATPADFLSGAVTASAGETSAILILLCGAYLAIRKFMDWRIPVAVLASAALTAWVFQLVDPSRYPDPLFVLLSGGLMIGAVFMATDMATSPVTPRGVWIYGALIGVVTVMIRYFGGLTEGVMYAILLGNALAPLIDQVTQPRVFGQTREKAAMGKKA
jgi:electron transport complex protein RnfD